MALRVQFQIRVQIYINIIPLSYFSFFGLDKVNPVVYYSFTALILFARRVRSDPIQNKHVLSGIVDCDSGQILRWLHSQCRETFIVVPFHVNAAIRCLPQNDRFKPPKSETLNRSVAFLFVAVSLFICFFFLLFFFIRREFDLMPPPNVPSENIVSCIVYFISYFLWKMIPSAGWICFFFLFSWVDGYRCYRECRFV